MIGDGEQVRLVMPATPELLRVARLTAAGLASRLGFSFDEVEDVKIAVDELCFALVGTKGREGT
ncbi:MAG: anti-sigma B factor RsbW, partial [Acidimicrobiia bacterium]|nr:anti-sigma B factor RsbW [Acidimicrobiia bacterium]